MSKRERERERENSGKEQRVGNARELTGKRGKSS